MSDLEARQAEAIKFAKKIIESRGNMTLYAAKCGKSLTEVKAGLKHGEFEPWIKKRLPIGSRQCQKYMKLHEGNPVIAGNTNSTSLLSIDVELALCDMDDEIESKVREEVQKSKLSQHQTLLLINKLSPSDKVVPMKKVNPISLISDLEKSLSTLPEQIKDEAEVNDLQDIADKLTALAKSITDVIAKHKLPDAA